MFPTFCQIFQGLALCNETQCQALPCCQTKEIKVLINSFPQVESNPQPTNVQVRHLCHFATIVLIITA